MKIALRRVALRASVAGTATGVLVGLGGGQVQQLVSLGCPCPRTVSVAVALIAIDESPPPFGVADSRLYLDSPADMKKQLDLLKDAGAITVRVAVPWLFIQPSSPAAYDWSQMVMLAQEDGMSVIATITGNPGWDGVRGSDNPNDDALATFASAVATRYRGRIDAYEVWNEPNTGMRPRR